MKYYSDGYDKLNRKLCTIKEIHDNFTYKFVLYFNDSETPMAIA